MTSDQFAEQLRLFLRQSGFVERAGESPEFTDGPYRRVFGLRTTALTIDEAAGRWTARASIEAPPHPIWAAEVYAVAARLEQLSASHQVITTGWAPDDPTLRQAWSSYWEASSAGLCADCRAGLPARPDRVPLCANAACRAIAAAGPDGPELEPDDENSVDELRRYLDDAHLPYQFEEHLAAPLDLSGGLFALTRAEDMEMRIWTEEVGRERRYLLEAAGRIPDRDFGDTIPGQGLVAVVSDFEKAQRVALRFAETLRRVGYEVLIGVGGRDRDERLAAAQAAGAWAAIIFEPDHLLERDVEIIVPPGASATDAAKTALRERFMDLFSTTPMSMPLE